MVIIEGYPVLNLIAMIVIIAFSAAFATYLFQRVVALIHKKLHASESDWLESFFRILPRPIQWSIWLVAILKIFDVTTDFIGVEDPEGLLPGIQRAGFILIGTWVLIQWKKEVEITFKEKLKARASDAIEKATIDSIGRFVTILIYMAAGLMMLDAVGVPPTTLLAFGGAGAFAAGLAAKSSIENVFGGLMIHLTRPFAVGDWINTPNKSFEGVVTEIGWYYTCIRSFERRPIYVPNSMFMSLVVSNPSRMSNRRILKNVGVRYDDFEKVRLIIADIRTLLAEHDEIAPDLFQMVHFHEYGPYSLDIKIYTFTKTTSWERWMDIQEEILLSIGDIITHHGAEVAFPTQTLKIDHEMSQGIHHDHEPPPTP